MKPILYIRRNPRETKTPAVKSKLNHSEIYLPRLNPKGTSKFTPLPLSQNSTKPHRSRSTNTLVTAGLLQDLLNKKLPPCPFNKKTEKENSYYTSSAAAYGALAWKSKNYEKTPIKVKVNSFQAQNKSFSHKSLRLEECPSKPLIFVENFIVNNSYLAKFSNKKKPKQSHQTMLKPDSERSSPGSIRSILCQKYA